MPFGLLEWRAGIFASSVGAGRAGFVARTRRFCLIFACGQTCAPLSSVVVLNGRMRQQGTVCFTRWCAPSRFAWRCFVAAVQEAPHAQECAS